MNILIVSDDHGLPGFEKAFNKAIKICNYLETAGYRHSGRQIYTLLRRSGFKNIKLKLSGIDTSEMNYDQRQDMFDTFFTFLKSDSKIMTERYPENSIYEDDYR